MLYVEMRSMGIQVLGRVECEMSDLDAADCVYHCSSYVNFHTRTHVNVCCSVELTKNKCF